MNSRMTTPLVAGLVGLLVGCQQMEPQLSPYQQQAKQLVGGYAQKLSRAMARNIRSAQPQAGTRQTGSWLGGDILNLGGWQAGVSPFGGQRFHNSMGTWVSTCVTFVKQIPEQLQYYGIMVATLSRCLTFTQQLLNPLMTYSFRTMGNDVNYLGLYGLDGLHPQPLHQFVLDYSSGSYNDIDPFLSFAQTGLLGSWE